jgi:hypothetical protein
MQWSDLPLNPSRRTLRQFAGLWIAFFGALACWQGFARGRVGVAVALGLLATIVGTLGLARPRAIRPVFVGWMVAAYPIGWVISRLLSTGLYYGLFTPVGWLFRLAGRDALMLRPQPGRESYWLPRPATTDPRRYFREF